jgi:murein DD-endopeptidase MepM/ murein hydrolase activator NlpD
MRWRPATPSLTAVAALVAGSLLALAFTATASSPAAPVGATGLEAASTAPTGEPLRAGPQTSLKKDLEKVGGTMKHGIQAGETVAVKFARYMRNAAAMRGFHDSVPLEGGAILDILRGHGSGQPGGGRPGGGTGTAQKFPLPPYQGGLAWPLEAGIVSSEFGQRWGKQHAGIDIAADVGEPVHAAAPGVAIYVGHGLEGYGNVVILRHDDNLTTLYAHNSHLEVKQGDTIKQGTVIAKVGSTGHSTGPHLHFEIRVGEKPINPRDRLPKNKYIGS